MKLDIAALAISLLLAAACRGARPEQPRPAERAGELGLAVPAGWSEAEPGENAAPGSLDGAQPFWESFGDAALDDVVREALAHNRSLGESAARLAAAAARARIARSARWPTLDASLGVSRDKSVFVGLPIPGVRGPLTSLVTTYDAGLAASWELDLWGRLASGTRAALAEVEASAAEHAAAQLSVAAMTVRAWFTAREARLQLELAERTLETYRRSASTIRERFDAGLVGALDLRLAEANVATSEASLAAARRTEGVAQRQLEVLLGRYPSAELAAPGDFGELPAPVPAGIPSELLARRPDLRVLERRLVAAEAVIDERRADRWPRIALTGSYGRTSDDVGDLLDGDFTVWTLASRLTAPLFDAGRRRAAVDEARADADLAAAAFAGAVLQAFSEVESALEAELLLREGREHLAVARSEADAALALADAQYREGLIGIELVLDSQRRLLAAESDLLAVQREWFVNRVDLVVALGGGFEVPAGTTEREPAGEPSGAGD